MDTLFQDLRFAVRMMARNPGFVLAAVLCLMLGIGATTGIFSVVNAVLLRPLPYKDAGQLVRVYTEFPTFPNGGLHKFYFSGPEYLDVRRDTKSWKSLDTYYPTGVNLAEDTSAVRASATFVSGGMMASLGVEPIMGRLVGPEDDKPGAPLAADISYGLWQRFFGANASIVGRETILNGRKCTIAGVMPRGFTFPPGQSNPAEVWVPVQLDPANPGSSSSHGYFIMGRLNPGVTLAQAQAEMAAYVHSKTVGGDAKMHRFDDKNHTLVSYNMQDEVVENVRPALLMLLGAVAFVLLISCVNVANLLLARAEARRREIAIRGALGAGMGRLARQFATEGVLLSVTGGLLGLGLAWAGLQMIVLTNAGSIPRADEISLDWRVLLFTLGTSLVTGVLFGFAPLIDLKLGELTDSLKDTAGGSTGSLAAQMFRRVLVSGELALALVLLIGCGLMVRAFWKLQAVDPGVDPRNVITMRVTLPRGSYPKPENTDRFWTQLEEKLNRMPGVETAGLATGLPPIRPAIMNDVTIEGFVVKPGGPIQNVDYWQIVNKDYFKAMGVRLLAGRFFEAGDGPKSSEVAIVNRAMEQTFWPGQSAIGRRLKTDQTWITIVGVVDDVKNAGVEKPAGTELYLPLLQPTGSGSRTVYMTLRAKGNPTPLIGEARRAVQEIDSAIPVANVQLMDDVLADAEARPRFLALLMTVFSGVALTIATVGIYGVISYSVARRSKEFGLRMALGAKRSDVLGLVMKQGVMLTVIGITAGLGLAFGLTRLMATLLYAIKPTDPPTFTVVPLMLAAVALLASYIPARRATTVDPMQSLRYE
jgi:putative ABC transport system permease protein